MNSLKLILILFSLQTIKAQQIDTLTYVKQFEINKAHYIGKPFSVLLNDMNTIKIRTVHSILSVKNKDNIAGSRFTFSNNAFKKNVVIMLIEWNELYPRNDIFNNYVYNSNEENYYKHNY